MQDALDAIIVGGGIIGRLTAWDLARSGRSVLLLEQHSLSLSKGSSRGSSRMFGETFARDIYFRLAHMSRYLWRELERETGEELLHLNGGLDISAGSNARESVKEITAILSLRRSQFDIFNSVSFYHRYPQWRYNPGVYAIYSPDSGILLAERCMNAAIVAAKQHGLTIREESRVVSIESCRSGTIRVCLSSGDIYRARKLVLAAGPWMPSILRRLGVSLPLRVSQEQTVYFSPLRNAELFKADKFPVWEREGPQFVYGFPIFEKEGIKISFHQDGKYLKDLKEFKQMPSRDVTNRLRRFLKRHIPDAAGEAFEAKTCLYTNTPDSDFVIDTVPGMPQAVFFTGCSGHAFHCAPALGRTLAELAIDGKTTLDISPFSLKRFKT